MLFIKVINYQVYFSEAKEAGYEPSITYDAGRLTSIRLSFFKNSLSIIVKNQDLVLDSLDGSIDEIAEEEIFNIMNSAMITFNISLFKSEHKSEYSNIDIDVLDEYRTLVPMGMLNEISNDIPIVEIDVS